MIREAYDYTRCVLKNKATLGGFFLAGTGIAAVIIEYETGINTNFMLPFFGVSPLLGSTGLGIDTYRTYKRTKKHILEHDTISPKFVEKTKGAFYCNQCGFELAAKEFGLEDLLKN